MDQENPNLIPPPSIGASPESRPVAVKRKSGGGSKLWLLVLACVVVGISLGVLVYQQSVAPESTPRPRTSPAPAASPLVPQVSEVTPSTNSVTFPKAGKIRIYYVALGGGPLRMYSEINAVGGSTTVEMPALPETATLLFQDTGMTVGAGENLSFNLAFDLAMQQKLVGYAPVRANQCGENGFGQVDVSSYISATTAQVGGEPLVSIQCWGDNTPGEYDFNDILVIWTYTPVSAASPLPSTGASASPSPSPSTVVTVSPSPSPAASKTPSPSPSPSRTPTPSPSKTPTPSPSKTPTPTPSQTTGGTTTVTPTPSPSARVAMPEGSALPDAGVFEVTVGTATIGIVLLILGLLGLLLL